MTIEGLQIILSSGQGNALGLGIALLISRRHRLQSDGKSIPTACCRTAHGLVNGRSGRVISIYIYTYST